MAEKFPFIDIPEDVVSDMRIRLNNHYKDFYMNINKLKRRVKDMIIDL